MATFRQTDCIRKSEIGCATAPQSSLLQPRPDPSLLTPEERLATFGHLLVRAILRRRSRPVSRHSSRPKKEQKRN